MTTGNERLLSIIESNALGTDKHTIHSYLEIYEELFSDRRLDCNTFLEIGMYTGASLFMWSQYFENATVYGIDPDVAPFMGYQLDNSRNITQEQRNFLLNSERSNIFFKDAYSTEMMSTLPNFDIIIDDGSHQLNHQIFCLQNYRDKLNSGGILVIEDVQDINHCNIIINSIEESERSKCSVIDLRENKGRYDDIIVVYGASDE